MAIKYIIKGFNELKVEDSVEAQFLIAFLSPLYNLWPLNQHIFQMRHYHQEVSKVLFWLNRMRNTHTFKNS